MSANEILVTFGVNGSSGSLLAPSTTSFVFACSFSFSLLSSLGGSSTMMITSASSSSCMLSILFPVLLSTLWSSSSSASLPSLSELDWSSSSSPICSLLSSDDSPFDCESVPPSFASLISSSSLACFSFSASTSICSHSSSDISAFWRVIAWSSFPNLALYSSSVSAVPSSVNSAPSMLISFGTFVSSSFLSISIFPRP